MSVVKRVVLFGAAAVAALSWAQPGMTPLQGFLGAQAGDYRFFQFDKGRLQKEYLDQVFTRSKEDRDYFLATVRDIESEFKVFLRHAVFADDALKGMSDRAKAEARFFPAIDFLRAINRFQQARIALDTKIESLTAMAGGALPSQIKIKADGSGLEDVPHYGNLDFGPIKAFYETRLDEITRLVANLPHGLILATGSEYLIAEGSGKGLRLDVPGLKLPAAKILELRKKIRDLRSWGPQAEDAINAYTLYTKRLVQKFIKTYGTTERWRSLGEGGRKERVEDTKRVAEAFWTRSYLRAVYGMPIGAIGIDYVTRPFHIDVITTTTAALGAFRQEPVWEQDEMMEVAKSYRLALVRANQRAAKILDGELGLIAAGENLITFLGGQRNLAQGLQMMLQLLAADLYEERLVQDADGIAKMAARYRSRYGLNDEDLAFYSKLRKAYDPQSEEEKQGASIGTSPESLNGKFQDTLVHMQTKEDELREAEVLQATVDAATGGNRWRDQRKKRIDDLFGPKE